MLDLDQYILKWKKIKVSFDSNTLILILEGPNVINICKENICQLSGQKLLLFYINVC